LIIQGEHKHQWHAGVEQTLAALRKRFWILKGRSAVKNVLRRCVVCRKENARCLNQIMAPLPKNRLVETHAFDNVGIDFSGPLYVKEGRTISKIYIYLFTCMATRAIHLEPTSDMTAQSFLAAFRRFISRRGKPSVVQTDNFRTFKLADKYIQDLFRGDEKQKIARAITEEKIEWRFSCERAPWCGGYWERLVRSVRTALRKVLAKALVSREELVTILCEIEARINARPLTTISDDSNDLEPLTPFHFLTGRTLMELPDMTTRRLVGKKSTSTTMTLRRRWYYQRKILRHLWQRWRKEYLVNFVTNVPFVLVYIYLLYGPVCVGERVIDSVEISCVVTCSYLLFCVYFRSFS
ncbi:Pro-Pol polyprotein, partial [Trichinella sp. T9]